MIFGLFAMWLLGACSNDRSAVQALNQSLDAPTMEQFDAVVRNQMRRLRMKCVWFRHQRSTDLMQQR